MGDEEGFMHTYNISDGVPPGVVARDDQLREEAVAYLRKAKQFMLITADDQSDEEAEAVELNCLVSRHGNWIEVTNFLWAADKLFHQYLMSALQETGGESINYFQHLRNTDGRGMISPIPSEDDDDE